MKKQYLISLLGLVALFIPLGNSLSNTNYSASTSEINKISSNASFEENKLKIDDTDGYGDYYYEYEIQQISAGANHNAALVEDTIHPNDNDALYTWGANDKGQLGNGATSNIDNPTKIDALPNGNIKEISLGSNHSAAVIDTGTATNPNDQLYTWGSNQYGQLGIGHTGNPNNETSYYNTPQEVTLLPEGDIEQISMGNNHSAAVINDGSGDELYTWGYNYQGQLGLGTNVEVVEDEEVGKEFEIYNTPWQVELPPETKNIEEISMGGSHSAMVIDNGRSQEPNYELYTCGANQYGQLGLGDNNTNDPYNTFQKVDGLPEKGVIEQISMGGYHSSAVINMGTEKDPNDELYTWGLNNSGQLGNGEVTNERYDSPERVDDLPSNSDITDISMASYWDKNASHSAAIVNDDNGDHLYTWGGNEDGGLGYTDVEWIESVAPFDHEKSKDSEEAYNSINCWPTPKEVIFDTNVKKESSKISEIKNISLGAFHTMAIKSDGTNDYLYAWGENNLGQLGNGTKDNSETPELSDNTSSYKKTDTEIKTDEVNVTSSTEATIHYVITLGKDKNGFLKEVEKVEWIDTKFDETEAGHSIEVLVTQDSNLTITDDKIIGDLSTNKLYPNTTYNTEVRAYSNENKYVEVDQISFTTCKANEPGTIETIGDPIIKTNTATISYVINPAKNLYGEPMEVSEVKWMAVTDGNPDNDIQIGSDTPENFPSDGKETITGEITTDSDLSKNAIYKETYLIVDGKHWPTDDDYQRTPYFSVKTGNFLTRNLIISASVIVVIIIIIAIILFFVFKWWKKRVIT